MYHDPVMVCPEHISFWAQGKLHNRIGLFPIGYVNMKSSDLRDLDMD